MISSLINLCEFSSADVSVSLADSLVSNELLFDIIRFCILSDWATGADSSTSDEGADAVSTVVISAGTGSTASQGDGVFSTDLSISSDSCVATGVAMSIGSSSAGQLGCGEMDGILQLSEYSSGE